jgi:hypothetical protein
MRRGILAFVFMFVGVSGIATAGVLAATGSSPGAPVAGHDKTEANEQDAGVHGGPIDRFHRARSCDLTGLASLPGNWTHGDYVNAVAADGTPEQIQEAAGSDCGKPMVAVGHGGGPPVHALEHRVVGQAHAVDKADDADGGTPGS